MSAGAIAVGLALDAALREPPAPVHPVRGAGGYLAAAGRLVPAAPPARAVLAGGGAWAVGAVAAVGAGAAVERAVRDAPAARRAAVLGLALWPLLARRLLLDEVGAVERGLRGDADGDAEGGVDAGRDAVRRLVSRDVSGLSPVQVRQAALESLAENLSDSVVAPLFWYAVGGLPAAALYRFANTADAQWGYRTPRWRYAGRVAARADDLLNLLPARLTGLALAAPAVGLGAVRAEAGTTPSPNAGWPMAALALRLGVRLEKPGAYVLGGGERDPAAGDTARALRIVRRRCWVTVTALAALAGVRARRASTTTRRRLVGDP